MVEKILAELDKVYLKDATFMLHQDALQHKKERKTPVIFKVKRKYREVRKQACI